MEVGTTKWTTIGFGERLKLVRRNNIEKGERQLMDSGDKAQEIK